MELELKRRTKRFALQVIHLVQNLPSSRTADVLGRQLVRSGTSVGANYRSACRAKSLADFAAKISIAEEEADESGYWLDLLSESKTVEFNSVENLIREADELTAIMAASGKTARTKPLKAPIENRKSHRLSSSLNRIACRREISMRSPPRRVTSSPPENQGSILSIQLRLMMCLRLARK